MRATASWAFSIARLTSAISCLRSFSAARIVVPGVRMSLSPFAALLGRRWLGIEYPAPKVNGFLRAAPGDAPDRAAAVLAYQQRAVVRDRHADRAAPDRGVVDHEAGQEILVFAGRHAVLEMDTDQLVSGPLRPVPRAMLGDERIIAIL